MVNNTGYLIYTASFVWWFYNCWMNMTWKKIKLTFFWTALISLRFHLRSRWQQKLSWRKLQIKILGI